MPRTDLNDARSSQTLASLDVFVGEWSMSSSLTPAGGDAPRARTTFEWLRGKQFLIQRWEVEHPDAPDGVAIIGYDSERSALVQHYFDSRGTARVYEMTFADKVWKLQRLVAAPDFCQRFTGVFDAGGNTIVGRWESSSDATNWTPDFDLTYSRVR
jgi:hypothetical protein